jgi:hypothetical protein
LFAYIYPKEEITSVKNYIFDKKLSRLSVCKKNTLEKSLLICIAFDQCPKLQSSSQEILE